LQPDFKVYTQPNISEHYEYNEVGEGLDIGTIIEDNEVYSSIVTGIKDTMTKAFKEAYQRAGIFRPYLKMYIENATMGNNLFLCACLFSLDISELRANVNIPLQFFREAITKYKQQIVQMKQMIISLEVGIIVVDSARLKSVLSPSPKVCLDGIEKLLPELAKIKNEELLSDLNTAMRTLTSTPKTVRFEGCSLLTSLG
jgi:hypothetical protein